MKILVIAGSLIASLFGASADAQTIVYWPASQSAVQQSQSLYLPMGTPLKLVTRSQISTKDNRSGERIYLEVAEGISYRGQMVIPAGSAAVGEISRSDRNGHFGKKGKIDIHLLYVETPNGPIRLNGQANDEGTSGTITSVATIMFVSPLGFLVHGTSAHLPSGTTVNAYLGDNLHFTPSSRPPLAGTMVQPDDGHMLPASFSAAMVRQPAVSGH